MDGSAARAGRSCARSGTSGSGRRGKGAGGTNPAASPSLGWFSFGGAAAGSDGAGCFTARRMGRMVSCGMTVRSDGVSASGAVAEAASVCLLSGPGDDGGSGRRGIDVSRIGCGGGATVACMGGRATGTGVAGGGTGGIGWLRGGVVVGTVGGVSRTVSTGAESEAGCGGTVVEGGPMFTGSGVPGEAGLRPKRSAFWCSSAAISSFKSAVLCADSVRVPIRNLWFLWVWYSGDFSPKSRRMVSRKDSSVLARTASP